MNPAEEAPEMGENASPESNGGTESGKAADDDSTRTQDRQRETRGNSDDLLTKNEIFTILKNSRRLQALKYLEANQGEASLGELAEHIAANESDADADAFSTKQRKRAYISLYQVHLPKMDDMGVLDFHKQCGTIELKEASRPLFPYLHVDPYSREHQGDESTMFERFRSARSRLSELVSFDSE